MRGVHEEIRNRRVVLDSISSWRRIYFNFFFLKLSKSNFFDSQNVIAKLLIERRLDEFANLFLLF